MGGNHELSVSVSVNIGISVSVITDIYSCYCNIMKKAYAGF